VVIFVKFYKTELNIAVSQHKSAGKRNQKTFPTTGAESLIPDDLAFGKSFQQVIIST
jgi:hypothetical protein